MSVLSIIGSPVPTGGAVTLALTFADDNPITLERAVSGIAGLGPWVTLYTGEPTPVYIDPGEKLPTLANLDPAAAYVWRVTDASGSVMTAAIQPVAGLNVEQELLTNLVIRLMQAGMRIVVPPAGITAPLNVLQAMPVAGVPPMPFVVVNPDLIQQAEVPIGQDVQNYDNDTGIWTQTTFVRRVFRVSITASNAPDREWYRDAAIAVWRSLTGSVFSKIGLDIRHRFQANSGQIAADSKGMTPGFYYSDVLLVIEGTMNLSMATFYGIIERIDTTAELPGGGAIEVSVPIDE